MEEARLEATHPELRDDARNLRVGSGDPLRMVSLDPLGDPAEAVQELVFRVGRRYGSTKALAHGLIPVGYPQIQRWLSDGGLPGLDNVFRLMILAGRRDPFREQLLTTLQHLFEAPAVDKEILAARLADRLGDPGIARKLLVYLEEIAPGRRIGVLR